MGYVAVIENAEGGTFDLWVYRGEDRARSVFGDLVWLEAAR